MEYCVYLVPRIRGAKVPCLLKQGRNRVGDAQWRLLPHGQDVSDAICSREPEHAGAEPLVTSQQLCKIYDISPWNLLVVEQKTACVTLNDFLNNPDAAEPWVIEESGNDRPIVGWEMKNQIVQYRTMVIRKDIPRSRAP